MRVWRYKSESNSNRNSVTATQSSGLQIPTLIEINIGRSKTIIQVCAVLYDNRPQSKKEKEKEKTYY